MQDRQDPTTEHLGGAMTPRRARLLQGLVDLAARIGTERDLDALALALAHGARDLFDARRAEVSMGPARGRPEGVHAAAGFESRPPSRDAAGGDGRDGPLPLDREYVPHHEHEHETEHTHKPEAGPIPDPSAHPSDGFEAIGPTPEGGLAVPLRGRDGGHIGIIRLWAAADRGFGVEDRTALEQLSEIAAIAVDNARAYQALCGDAGRKDEFLAMLAHELRNPLAAIGNAARLVERSDERDDLAWSVDLIGRQVGQLTRLVDDLMDMSRVVRGKLRLRREVLETTPLLEEAAGVALPLVEARRQTLELDLDRGRLWAEVDPTRLEQVAVNLLTNAARYSEDGGHIRLSARVEAGELVIRVRDDGRGIPPERLPEMFELFAQGDDPSGHSEAGLGVGLALVKRLVELHGGSVLAESDGLGRGSEFIVKLPAASGPTDSIPSSQARSRPDRSGTRILLVDDNVDVARSMARLLGIAGYEVTTAHHGDEAILAASTCRPSIVLLDIGLQGMSGYEVASRLRSEECCRGARFIAISGFGQGEDLRRSREAGFAHHLTKPIDHDALLALLSAERN